MKKAIIIIVILAIIGGALALVLNGGSDNKTENPPAASSTPSTSTNTNNKKTKPSAAATITYTDNGFSPSTLTVKAGTTVTIKNDSASNMQFDSDPHPVHTDDPELNVGAIAPGESLTFTPTTKGTHGYHNHLNPTDTGTLIVQ